MNTQRQRNSGKLGWTKLSVLEEIPELSNKDSFADFITSLIEETSKKPSITEVGNRLNIARTTANKYINLYEVKDLIDYHTSQAETGLFNLVSSWYSGEIIRNDRTQIAPYELDIYIPEKKLAIEFNRNILA